MLLQSQKGHVFLQSTLAILLAVAFANTSHATIVGAQSFGNELAGGKITVTYLDNSMHTETIQDGGGTLGFVNAPGFFDFKVDGDTFLADWSLTNNNDNIILLVEFDLTDAGVLFDDGSLPDTMNGFAGRAGAVQQNVGFPTINNSFETAPWADPMNAGDEYVKETIEYLSQDFRLGSTSIWRDDTDIIGKDTGPEVPEPATCLIALLSAAGLACIRRK